MIKSFDATILKTANELQVDSFSIVTNASRVKGKTKVYFNPRKQTVDQLKISLSADVLDPDEWGFDKYYPYPLRAEIRGSGNLSQLNLDTLQVSSQHIALASLAKLQFDSIRQNTKLTLTIDSLRVQSSVLSLWHSNKYCLLNFMVLMTKWNYFIMGICLFPKIK